MIEVLLLCETPPPFSLPENVRCRPITREELLHRLNSVTDLDIRSISGHKLCDFRPFFGLAFADQVSEFEFWGFCDMDLMFGDLSSVLTARELEATDIFTAHDSQLAGHFSFFRNTGAINEAAFRIDNWRVKCSQPDTCLLEELDFPKALRLDRSLRWACPEALDRELEKKFCSFGVTFDFLGAVAHTKSASPALVRWRDGRAHFADASGRDSEVLYVHFMGLKRWWHWLSLRGAISGQEEHRFSRVGYGGPRYASALTASPWLQIYAAQNLLGTLKSRAGGLARRLLPAGAFRHVRRALLGRGRF